MNTVVSRLESSLALVLLLSLVSSQPASAQVADEEILEAVTHALEQDADLVKMSAKATVDHGVVHLTGGASTLAAKLFAVQEAEKIRGVISVLDEIVVLPAKKNDKDIVANVRRHVLGGRVESTNLKSDQAKRPLLLHCHSANRVGAIWLAHRVLDDGLSLAAAEQEATTVGLKSPEYLAKAQDYTAQTVRTKP